jgi:RNA polymerase sigma-70 factor (ECF subfamily)
MTSPVARTTQELPPLTLGQRNEEPTDERLAAAARGDTSAFAGLYHRYLTPIYRYARSQVGNSADAEDLTAQVFTQALQQIGRYVERGSFPAWLFTIARRRVADYRRRTGGRAVSLEQVLELPGEEVEPVQSVMRQEDTQRLGRLLSQMEPEQQELLSLRFAAGLGYREIASVTGRSEAAAKMAVRRLLDRLRAHWGDADEN